jgi:hypothetical protein
LGLPEADNPVAWCIETMKHRFIDFTQVVFCGGQKAGNEFLGLIDHLNHFFIDFTKVAFCDIQKADNEFSGPFDRLKHRAKLIRIAYRPLET